MKSTPDTYTRRVMTAVALVALVFVVWELRGVLPLLFGGIILATGIRALSEWVARETRLPQRGALAVVVITLLTVIGVGFWLVGAQVAGQLAGLWRALPNALEAASNWLSRTPFTSILSGTWQSLKDGGVPWLRVAGAAGVATTAVFNTFLILALGLYLAADPRRYYEGVLRLSPRSYRERIGAALSEAGHALRRWLLGQLVSMTTIAIMTSVAFFLLGIPLALSLGLIAGATEFVPFFGPIAFGIFSVLFAFTLGPTDALYVGLTCFAIQQFEGYVLQPFIQRWAVSLAPALALLSVVIFALLFGFLGAILATPMMTVVVILVDRLYARE
ncbi:MAG TPA: AI-2E family transporter [Casimicrobiaceae bacterium]|nr:AI-2E family transporter [Casimicrobiaceae bacterium]